jgi:hypothetical protein
MPTTTEAPTTTETPTTIDKSCDDLPLYDIFIMVDGSIADNVNFTKVKQFLVNFVGAANIGPTESRMGMLQYSHLISLEMQFRSSQVKSDILETIEYMPYQNGVGRYTGQALQAIKQWVCK